MTHVENVSREWCRQKLEHEDRKDVKGKPLPLLMPYEAFKAYTAASDAGLAKHGDRETWMYSTDGIWVYSNAIARHLFQAVIDPIDEETKIPHYYCVLWNAVAAVWHYERNK